MSYHVTRIVVLFNFGIAIVHLVLTLTTMFFKQNKGNENIRLMVKEIFSIQYLCSY